MGPDDGRAYVYLGSAGGLSASPSWTAASSRTGADFGCSVGTAGDVNGDGYSDVIVGADHDGAGGTDEGRAYVYLGSAGGLSASPSWTVGSGQAGADFGCSVGTAGDVNGDGYSDVIVGAGHYDDGETGEGRAYVYLGSTSGLSAHPHWTAEGGQAGADFGCSVGTAGDVNGDGFSDVVVGADHNDDGETDEGRACVYEGSATGLRASPSWTVDSGQAGAELGCSVGTAGDVNGDGYADVIVGARLYNNGQASEGRVYVYQGSAMGLAPDPDWTTGCSQAGALFGCSVATAGDVNGDGRSDIIVGASGYSDGEAAEGMAFVYDGLSSGTAMNASWSQRGDQTSAFFGHCARTAGDVNGDGGAR